MTEEKSVLQSIREQLEGIYESQTKKVKDWAERGKKKEKDNEELLQDIKSMQALMVNPNYPAFQRVLELRKEVLRKSLAYVLSSDYNSLFKGAREEKAIGLSNRLDEVEFLMSEPKRIAESLEEK